MTVVRRLQMQEPVPHSMRTVPPSLESQHSVGVPKIDRHRASRSVSIGHRILQSSCEFLQNCSYPTRGEVGEEYGSFFIRLVDSSVCRFGRWRVVKVIVVTASVESFLYIKASVHIQSSSLDLFQ